MFDLQPFKHPDHKERRTAARSLEELCNKRPDERTLPYLSISLEQWAADPNFNSMNGTDQGDFFRLLRPLWIANGLLPDYAKYIAHELGFTEEGWLAKRQRFIDCGLLVVSPDGCSLLNMELRDQYLNTLIVLNSRRK
jgi:hypothetical protein